MKCGGPYPGEDREEGEGDGCPGSVPSLLQWVVLMLGHLPLVCQETETHKPHEGPERWKERQVRRQCHKDGIDLKGSTILCASEVFMSFCSFGVVFDMYLNANIEILAQICLFFESKCF